MTGYDFLTTWSNLCADVGLGKAAGAAIGADLTERHGEPHRHYHTADHVEAVIGHLHELGAASPVGLMAAFFHDAIYDPTQSDNEARSAELAGQALAAYQVSVPVQAVQAIIAATADHRIGPEAPAETASFLDADMAILAAPASSYDHYVSAVRQEYSHLGDGDFRAGRRAFVAELLARDHIFVTAAGRDRYEEPARTNLTRELGSPAKPGPGRP